MDSVTLKYVITPFKTKIIKRLHTILRPDLSIFKLQQEVLNFSDICVSWNSPKTDLVTNFLNLEN